MSGGANLGSRLTADMAPDGDIHIRDHLLYELARDLSSSLELDSVLRNVMDRVISLMHASRGFIVLVDPPVARPTPRNRAISWAPRPSSTMS